MPDATRTSRGEAEALEAEQTARSLFVERVEREAAERARHRMREIFDGIGDRFLVVDRELRLQFCNSAAVAPLGLRPDDVVGKHLIDEIAPETRGTALHNALLAVRDSHAALLIEEHYAAQDQWFELHVYPLHNRDIAVHARDITARKRNDELRERLSRLDKLRGEITALVAQNTSMDELLHGCCEALVSGLHAAFARVWLVDEPGTTLELHSSAGMYTHIDGGHARVPVGKFKIGRIAEERSPHLTNDVVHDPRVGDREWAKREGLVSFAGYPLIVEGRMLGVVAMFGREPLANETMSVLGLIADVIAQGVERRRAEENLVSRARDLARSNRDLEQFAYVASHDLQEPLRTIASYVQLLERRYKGKLDDRADEFIGFVVDAAGRMQKLIDDLLLFSRAGSRDLSLAELNLSDVLKSVERDLGPALQGASAVVTHDDLPRVIGDRGQLAQLLQNLIGNAVKFHGEEAPRVHVGAKQEGDEWIVSVRDNGIGIEPQYFDKIFVIFQRLHGRAKYPGTGIGLSVCKRIVERHGGRIWVEPAPEGGSVFFFSLPIKPRTQRSELSQ